VARRFALLATGAVGLYVALVTPPVPLIRVYGIVAILATYLLVRQIAHRVAMELLPR
jgi:disulfide bond formation protein DsbB